MLMRPGAQLVKAGGADVLATTQIVFPPAVTSASSTSTSTQGGNPGPA
eukprot:CAMPEP_0118931560 /NCGR_PEP_ID=MMETSP1169-20130426/7857_1 /TAXON_ID=36882 /ORGANISM="Pyramimonas obovata, Strain CCMP722" /LENGTH=47 /DNA_ID= /DNA_START= /DNA_END= /DNA_ORIENTATION=